MIGGCERSVGITFVIMGLARRPSSSAPSSEFALLIDAAEVLARRDAADVSFGGAGSGEVFSSMPAGELLLL